VDQHRIVGESLRQVDDPVEELLVPDRREAEPLADRSLLRADRSALALVSQEIANAWGRLRILYGLKAQSVHAPRLAATSDTVSGAFNRRPGDAE